MTHAELTSKKPIAGRFISAAALISLLTVAGHTSAQETVRMQDAIERTLESHPELALWSYRQQDVQALSDAASQRQPAQLSLSVDDAMGTGQYEGVDAMQTTLSARWLLEGKQVQARTDHASAQQQVLSARQRLQLAETKAETAALFVALLADQERLTLAREALEDERKLLRIVERRVDAGRASATDLVLARTRLTERELALEEYSHRLQAAALRLSAQWGAVNEQLTASGNIHQAPTLDKPAVLKQLNEAPVLGVTLTEADLFTAEGRLSRAEAATPWVVAAGVRRFEAGDDYALVAELSIPLGGGARNAALNRSLQAREQQSDVSAQARLKELEVEVRTLLLELEHSRHVIDTLNQSILPALSNGREQAQQAYERGQLDYLQWDNARQQWLSARERLLDEAEALQLQWIELQRLTGQATYF